MPHYTNTKTLANPVEGIRLRPKFYLGEITQQRLHDVLYETTKRYIDPTFINNATFLKLTLSQQNAVAFEDNGPGIPVIPYTEITAQSILEDVLLHNFAGGYLGQERMALSTFFADSYFKQETYTKLSFLLNWGTILTAFSAWIIVETTQNGQRYRVAAEQGKLTQSLTLLGPTETVGTRIAFQPDPLIWGDLTIDPAVAQAGLDQLGRQYPNATIVFTGPTPEDPKSGADVAIAA